MHQEHLIYAVNKLATIIESLHNTASKVRAVLLPSACPSADIEDPATIAHALR